MRKWLNETTWKKVSQSVSTYLIEKDPERRMEKIIALSYDKLPYHLRACYLYLGMFPEDFQIPAWKLIRMWIAEGFIQQNIGVSLEETAEGYLEDLISRNLVRIDKVKSDGKIKTCRIHDMLRDFCINEARNEKENFLQEIKKTNEGFAPPISQIEKYRRLCIHSDVLSFISSKPYGHRVRSFVCFSKEEVILPADCISNIPTSFKLLRVLDVKPIIFSKSIPSDMYQLLHLRYIVLSFNLSVVPAHFSKLWNLQTLIVDTPSRKIAIRADIWNMLHLRHLKTNASASLPKRDNSSDKGGQKLQTLDTISPESCSEQVFDTACNLKKLGIRGPLASLIDGKIGSFGSLRKLDHLENLKLLNDVFPRPASEGQLRYLPQPYEFPPKLKSLTLSDTSLDWSHMSILGSLEKLIVLKLKDNAFMGKTWKTADGGFRHLEVLHIGPTNLVVWKASGHHFPKLRRLELYNCEELIQVPIRLADIPSLQFLELNCSNFAAASAKEIRNIKKKQQEQTTQVSIFKLSVFPPHDEY